MRNDARVMVFRKGAFDDAAETGHDPFPAGVVLRGIIPCASMRGLGMREPVPKAPPDSFSRHHSCYVDSEMTSG